MCGSDAPLTKEHVMPDHWRREFPDTDGGSTYRARDGIEGRDVERDVPGSRYNALVRAVCGPCNHGWMQRIDMDAKPMLLELAWGRSTRIAQSDAALFARWATKTALMRALTDAESLRPTRSLFNRFHRDRSSFGERAVQIGHADNTPDIDSNTSKAVGARTEDGQVVASASVANVITYTLGTFFFQVALFDPDLELGTAATRQMMTAARLAVPGAIVPLREDRDNALPARKLTAEELQRVREPLNLLGQKSFVGNQGVELT